MALRRFFIPPEMLRPGQPEITGSDAVHICRVLRLAAGERVELFDGSGQAYQARIISVAPERVRLSIERTVSLETEPCVSITLAQGILKDRKMDDQIRQLTELGVARWIPFYASRSVPVPREKGLGNRLQRWEKIAREAVKQCRRGRIPQISPANDFDHMLAAGADCDLKILFWEGINGAFDLPATAPQKPGKIMVVVGPEGGFTTEEVRRAKAQGFFTTGLGPRILRAETAVLAACTLMQYRFGDMGAAD